ncbi:neocarzinostatin apoprotein domain-containing protein [Streptomyces sp. NPDC088789]|uniref:neocarzinostatin apoprotein domain-containing protein n=1 Tax=Streptomyces sp. NPDC088789 TaxID=3365899 RepID=UPI00381053C7
MLSAGVLALLLVGLMTGGARAAEDGPAVRVSEEQAGTGGTVTVSGTGWRADTLLMLLICGRADPSRGVVGGTNSCANADGRAVTTDAEGRFSRRLPVVEPPVPCPCVVHAATATGPKAQADTEFQVAGHAVEPLPAEPAGGRLSVLTDTTLDGSGGLLTWFGAPPARTLVFTVGNVGTEAVKDPVFELGASHGVFAPKWEEQQWQGTIRAGKKARIELPVELAAGAHGDYTVSLKYSGRILAEQPWDVGRPWGVTLFWVLVCVVVPAAVFRVGMAVVDRVAPKHRRPLRDRLRAPLPLRLPLPFPARLAGRRPGRTPSVPPSAPPSPAPSPSTTLPWFTPDSVPHTASGTAGGLSAPHEDPSTFPTFGKGPP